MISHKIYVTMDAPVRACAGAAAAAALGIPRRCRHARPKYRGESGADALPDALLRDLVRNYHPGWSARARGT